MTIAQKLSIPLIPLNKLETDIPEESHNEQEAKQKHFRQAQQDLGADKVVLSNYFAFVVYPETEADIMYIVDLCKCNDINYQCIGNENSKSESEDVIGVNLSRFNQVLEVNAEDGQVWVQSGITISQLNEKLLPYGLFFPCDPGADCPIGCLLANDSNGPFATGYGKLSSLVLGFRLVDNREKEIYNLGPIHNFKSLLLGSQGRFGSFLNVLLVVVPIPKRAQSLRAIFPTQKDAWMAAFHLEREMEKESVLIARCEYLDANLMQELDKQADGPCLFIELHSKLDETTFPEEKTIQELLEESGNAVKVEFFPQGSEAEAALWLDRYRVWSLIQKINNFYLPPHKALEFIDRFQQESLEHKNSKFCLLASPLIGELQVFEKNGFNWKNLSSSFRKEMEELFVFGDFSHQMRRPLTG